GRLRIWRGQRVSSRIISGRGFSTGCWIGDSSRARCISSDLYIPKEHRKMLPPHPRLRHPIPDRVLPAKIMLRLLMLREVVLLLIDLVEHEPRRIVFGAKNIESNVPRLL